jgi:hypothetical protein
MCSGKRWEKKQIKKEKSSWRNVRHVFRAFLYVCCYSSSVLIPCTILSEQLVYMFAVIPVLFWSLLQFCLNSSFRCLLLFLFCSDPLYNFIWTACLDVFIVIAFVLKSLYICVWTRHSFICCHQKSVQVPMYYSLNRLFVIHLLSSEVPSDPCESLSEQIFIYLLSSHVCSGACAWMSEDIYVFAVIRSLFRPLCIIVWRPLDLLFLLLEQL